MGPYEGGIRYIFMRGNRVHIYAGGIGYIFMRGE